jgi:hypothetical protein
MQDNDTASSNPTLAKRTSKVPWYHFHFVTAFVVLFLLGIMTMLQCEAHIKESVLTKSTSKSYQYGSPWIYLECTDLRLYGDVQKFSPLYLSFDILMGLSVVFLVALLIERCRRNTGFIPVDLVPSILLVGCVLWWCVIYHNQRVGSVPQLQSMPATPVFQSHAKWRSFAKFSLERIASRPVQSNLTFP